MKLSKSLLSVLMVSTMVIGSVSFAVTDIVALQQGALAQMKAESLTLQQEGAEYNKLASVLSDAKKTAAGYRIDISTGGKLTTSGNILVPLAGGARVYQQIAKQRGRFVVAGKRPMEILVALGVIAFGGGYAMEKNGATHIDLADADVAAAVAALNNQRENMIFRRGVIADIASKAGAKVTQSIDTHENVTTITGLDGLQTIVGSGIMTLPVPMQIPMPIAGQQQR